MAPAGELMETALAWADTIAINAPKVEHWEKFGGHLRRGESPDARRFTISGERRGTLPGCWKNKLSLVVCSYWISHITKIKYDQNYYCTD